MSLYFESQGWEVAVAIDGLQARAIIEEPFDAMICDLNLSANIHGDGVDVLIAAQSANPTAVRILLSGEGSPRAPDATPDAIVQKPVRLPVLEKMVADLCARRASTGLDPEARDDRAGSL
jgi:DNA-binding NtrC family response regulator